VLVELLARSQSAFHDVGVVCRPATARRLTNAQARVWSIPMARSIRPGRDARDLGRIVRIVRSFRPDVIHAHSSKAGALGRVAGALTGVPVVFSPHNFAHLIHEGGPLVRRGFRLLERTLAPLTTHLHVAYELERQEAITSGLAESGRVSVIPNGIDTRPLLELDSRPHSPPRVGTFARLWPQKRIDLLLEAAAQLIRASSRVELLVIGDGPLRNSLEEHTRTLGIAESTRFASDPGGPTKALAMLDIFVLSSDREAFPLAPMEAMAAGRPVVATAVGALPEIVEKNQAGLIVPAGDVSALAGALERLLSDRELHDTASRNGRRVARERFDISVMAERMDAVYQTAIHGIAPYQRAARKWASISLGASARSYIATSSSKPEK